MHSIPISFTIKSATAYQVVLNHEHIVEHSQATIEFETPLLKDHKMQCLEIRGDVAVERLVLDGIDTEYFVHHGFTSGDTRGNADSQCVRYYFQTPVWRWYMNWRQHDNSTFRQISKDHSGFLPL
jgi:hypothetical protein